MANFYKRIQNILRSINNHPLAGKHKIKAYYKFINWQLLSHVWRKGLKVKFTESTFLFVKNGMAGATGNIYMGLHEFEDMGFLLHFLNPEDLFLDIGSNIGSYTILASGQIGAKTIAFEPVPSTFKALTKNIELNNIDDKAIAMEVATGSAIGVINFTTNLDTINHVKVQQRNKGSKDSMEVPILTIDSITLNHGYPKLAKIDVEGFETEVLKGMADTLNDQNLKAIIIELNGSGERYGFDENEIHQLLLKNSFCPYNYDPFTRQLKLLNTYGKFNTIYIRDIDFVKERISKSGKVSIFSEKF